jgi:NTP pyrophosphatase (non-canonical NTP hydrolase)
METDSLTLLTRDVRAFAAERSWEPFHTPKNLAMALAVEAAELMEHFQWLTADESAMRPPDARREIGHEMADVLIYLVRMADELGIDLVAAARDKLALNAGRYPVDAARGNATKYGKR